MMASLAMGGISVLTYSKKLSLTVCHLFTVLFDLTFSPSVSSIRAILSTQSWSRLAPPRNHRLSSSLTSLASIQRGRVFIWVAALWFVIVNCVRKSHKQWQVLCIFRFFIHLSLLPWCDWYDANRGIEHEWWNILLYPSFKYETPIYYFLQVKFFSYCRKQVFFPFIWISAFVSSFAPPSIPRHLLRPRPQGSQFQPISRWK